ncbi:MAG: ribose 5-phosphate isomerase B [Fimbriimonadaceae bacterium]|nr:ribose 5-phosphate isomerase B [Chitinophagales bacterium]
MKQKIAIGCDHAGFPHKDSIIKHLTEIGHEVKDFGTFSLESVDYPDFVHPVAISIESKTCDAGILLCGSGNGVAITANKHKNIRAALVWRDDISALSRQHNDANVICLPTRFITLKEAIHFIEIFLATEFEGGRHARRVEKISENC